FRATAEAGRRVLELLEKSETVSPEDAGWAVNHLAPLLTDPRSPYPPLVRVWEALLRAGADPWPVLGLMVERLADAVETAAEPIRAAPAHESLEVLCAACLPLLHHFPHARQLLREREGFGPALGAIAPWFAAAAEMAEL